MKKFFSAAIVLLLLMMNTVVFADNNPSVSIDIKGNIEGGQNIQILINVSDVKNLYAGAAKFKYDKNILKVTGFEKGDLISKSGVNVFDVGNKIDNDNGIAEFGGFSCLGHVDGFSGSGTFLIIDAQVFKKDNFHIKSVPLLSEPNEDNNLKIQLVDNNAKEMNYNFTGYDFKINSNGTETVSQPKSTEAAGNPTNGVRVGTNNNEGIGGTSQDNAQGKSGNAGSGTGGNNASNSNENSNIALNNSTANGNNSENASSKTKSGSASSGKNQALNSADNSKNLNTNDSKNQNSIFASRNNMYLIVGICLVVVLALGFAVFKFILKKNI